MGLLASLFGMDTAKKEAIRGEIDLTEAVEAHMKWKHRLQDYVEGKSSEQLDPLVVARDDQCKLGQWIHGPALHHFHDDKSFEELRKDHAQFHFAAANVVKDIQENKRAEAEKILSGEYAAISHKVVAELTELNKLVTH
jgi:hypothetical protein